MVILNNNGQGVSRLGISEKNTWALNYYGVGTITGQARCSTQNGTGVGDANTLSDVTKISNLADETGQTGAQYCYCNITGYTPNGGTVQSLSTPWVFNNGYYSDADGCANGCAESCEHDMHFNNSAYYLAFRAAMFEAANVPATCEANTITIYWSNASAADISANNAGTTTYGSDVRTPVKAKTQKGKTFKGWRFSKPTITPITEPSQTEQVCETITDQQACESREVEDLGYTYSRSCEWLAGGCYTIVSGGGSND